MGRKDEVFNIIYAQAKPLKCIINQLNMKVMDLTNKNKQKALHSKMMNESKITIRQQ